MSELIHAIDLRPGNAFILNNNLYRVIENHFNKTAMGKGIVKCKCKNLRTGSITIEVLTGEKVEKADLTSDTVSFSYEDGANLVFLDSTTYESIEIPKTKLE
jgi:elongation factor P